MSTDPDAFGITIESAVWSRQRDELGLARWRESASTSSGGLAAGTPSQKSVTPMWA